MIALLWRLALLSAANSTGNRMGAMNEKEGLPGRRRRRAPEASARGAREIVKPGRNDQFERGVEHFNAREFFEAHEVWEELWLRAPEPEKTFLQGIIQVAAAFHHYGRGNFGGTRSLLVAGLSKLQEFPRSHRGIDLAGLRGDVLKWLERLTKRVELGQQELPQIHPAGRPRKATAKNKSGG